MVCNINTIFYHLYYHYRHYQLGKINNDVDLLDIDQEFQDNHMDILNRFYKLFESIWRYQSDFAKYIDDINNGFYIQHSIDNILEGILLL